jgi:hypothetical protein
MWMEWANKMVQTMGGGDVNDCSSGMEQKTLKESFELRTSWSSSEKKKNKTQQINIEICAQISILICLLLFVCEGEDGCEIASSLSLRHRPLALNFYFRAIAFLAYPTAVLTWYSDLLEKPKYYMYIMSL